MTLAIGATPAVRFSRSADHKFAETKRYGMTLQEVENKAQAWMKAGLCNKLAIQPSITLGDLLIRLDKVTRIMGIPGTRKRIPYDQIEKTVGKGATPPVGYLMLYGLLAQSKIWSCWTLHNRAYITPSAVGERVIALLKKPVKA